jgi:hypothetical protein
LQVTAGVQSELLHPRVGGKRMQPLLPPRPHLSYSLLDITVNSF